MHCVHPNCQKIWYKNVYEILIQTCTPKISCLPWKQKSWQNSAKCQLIKSCGYTPENKLEVFSALQKKSRAYLFPNFLSGLTLVRCYRDANKMLVRFLLFPHSLPSCFSKSSIFFHFFLFHSTKSLFWFWKLTASGSLCSDRLNKIGANNFQF